MELTEAKKELERRLFTAIDWFHVVLDRKPTVFMDLPDWKNDFELNIVCSVDEELTVIPLLYMIKQEVAECTNGAGKVDQEPMKGTAAYLKKCLEFVESKIKTKPAWVPCPDCDEWWCVIHEEHVHDCDCPALDDWVDLEVDPYLEGAPREQAD